MFPRNQPSPHSLSYKFQVNDDLKGTEYTRTCYVNAPKKEVLIFRGAGGRAPLYIKAVEIMAGPKYNVLQNIKLIGGSSSGSLTGVFTAIPFNTPKDRSNFMQSYTANDTQDVLPDTVAARIYRFITTPLYLISLPLYYVSKPFSWLAYQIGSIKLKKIIETKTINDTRTFDDTFIGKVVTAPMNIIGGVLWLASLLSHPLAGAAIYNLITRKAIYRGKKMLETFENSIKTKTQEALVRFIETKKDVTIQIEIAKKLSNIGLLESFSIKHNNKIKLKVTPSVNFKHFHFLATEFPTAGFKDIFITATRQITGELLIFDYKSTPTMPVALAVRLSMSVPFVYETIYLGFKKGNVVSWEPVIDGGCVNNCPIKSKDLTISSLDFNHSMPTWLATRIESKSDMSFLWGPTKNSWLDRKIEQFLGFISKKLIGIDVYASSNQVNENIKTNHANSVIQLNDQGIGLGLDLFSSQKKSLQKSSTRATIDFFEAHKDEKLEIQNFSKPEDMPVWMQKKYREVLNNPNIKNEQLFRLPGKSNDALMKLREQEIATLNRLEKERMQALR